MSGFHAARRQAGGGNASGLGHDGFGGAQHRRDQRARVEVALAGGTPWTTLASTCWVSAPRRVRLPPHTLRVTTAGRMACSARQLVACQRKADRAFLLDLKERMANSLELHPDTRRGTPPGIRWPSAWRSARRRPTAAGCRSAGRAGRRVGRLADATSTTQGRSRMRPCSLISPAFERVRRARPSCSARRRPTAAGCRSAGRAGRRVGRRRQTVLTDFARVRAGPQGEAVLQDRLHRARPGAVGMSCLQVLASSQEVSLMPISA